MDNLVSAAIFGDGAACAILGPTQKFAPRILDTQMYHFPDAARLMGINVTVAIIMSSQKPISNIGSYLVSQLKGTEGIKILRVLLIERRV